MSIDSSEIRSAVELIGADDYVDGKPSLVAVQRVMNNDALTQADLDAVMAAGETKAAVADVGTAPKEGSGGAPVQPAVRTAEPGGGEGADPDNRPESIAPSEDRTAIMLAEVEALKKSKAALLPDLADLATKKEAIDAALAAAQRAVSDIDVKVEEATAQISDADMVKRIQKQTQDRLMQQAEHAKTVAAAMNGAGFKTYASELDRELAIGGKKRSKVMLEPGKPFEAPHPRSPEGVRSYANWVHHGAHNPA